MRARLLAPWLVNPVDQHSHDALPDTLLLSAGPGFGSQSKPAFPSVQVVREAPANEERKKLD